MTCSHVSRCPLGRSMQDALVRLNTASLHPTSITDGTLRLRLLRMRNHGISGYNAG